MEKKKCLHCAERFIPSNGNAQYCCQEHYKAAKKLRQKRIYDLIKKFTRGFYNNLKAFSRILPSNGEKEIPILKAKELGFDENAFYGIAKDDNRRDWYQVSNYWFTIIEKNGTENLLIHKNDKS